MKIKSFSRFGLLLVGVCTIPVLSYAAECTTPKSDLFLNPFNKSSAHHRPIGTGATYAGTNDPSTKSWLSAPRGISLNVGAPWGVSVAATDASDPLMTVGAAPVLCNKTSGFPRTMRLPREGFETNVALSPSGCKDGVVVIYDGAERLPHEIYQYDWNKGKPVGAIYKTWSVTGLGHGIKPGDRLGTSASGVAMLFGILRGAEINDPSKKIEHALQMVLPATPKGCAMMLSRKIVLPAVTGDGFMNNAGNNLGNIPYGALMALPPVSKGGPNLDTMGLTARGKRIAEAVRDYGIYAVDTGNCPALRTDQFVQNTAELKAALAKIYPYIRMVTNNDVLGSAVAGGGTPLAPNCAFDASGTTPPPPVKVNGTCGSANGVAVTAKPTSGLCSAGTASAVTGTGPWIWTCAGSGGGSTASCSAPKKTTSVGTTLRIEAGNTASVTTGGNTWSADKYFTGGSVVDRGDIAIAGTTDDKLYQTERYGLTGYALPVTNGNYTVKLHFAETYTGVTASGNRVFSVNVEGKALGNIDVFKETGARNTALIKTVTGVTVSDGTLNINFTKISNAPMINAIEVLPN